MGRFLPPDHSQGDERTIGGYIAVHARPAAFEGADGASYSVSIEVDASDDPAQPLGGYLFFVRWSPGEPRASGHLESDFLVRGDDDASVRAQLGALSLEEVKRVLDALIQAQTPAERRWWDVMRES